MNAIILVAALSMSADLEPIRLPAVKVVTPQPAPAPTATEATIKLTAGYMYVIDSDVPILVLDSPRGRVKKVSRAGPMAILSKFVGGTGDYEETTFKGKHIVTIQAATTGPVELLIVPEGSKSEANVRRVSLVVEAGEGPRPPPVNPDVKPEPPKPDPPKPVATKADAKLVETLTAAIAEDAKTFSAGRKPDSPATLKEAVALIGETYGDAVSILSIGDVNLKPKTWGELVGKVGALSISKKIPTVPALMRVRDAVADHIGKRNSDAVLTDDDLTKIVAVFETVSASLKEAAK